VNKAILSGQGKSFEIWDERTWKDQIEKLDRLSSEEEIPQQVLSLSL
jgi:MraZ protein